MFAGRMLNYGAEDSRQTRRLTMPLKVIGVGYPRTGTASFKAALEQLGIGRCYHMSELLARPGDCQRWVDACDGKAVDWDEIFKDYAATADAPGCHFYEALAEEYPTAKFVLTVRDANRWFDSTQATILSPGVVQRFASAAREFNVMMHKLDWHPQDASTHDREKMIARIAAHNEAVKRSIPSTRLLIYELAQGWQPLCEFLGLPIPDAPFPHINSTEDFRQMMASMEGLDPDGVKRNLETQLSKQ
jgi:hypothetical protein